jgi:alkylmercury lyase
MNPTTEVRDLADALEMARPRMDAGEQRIAIAIYRQLAAGGPVTPTEIATASGATEEQVARALLAWPGVLRDATGSVVGFWGLSVAEMPPHQIIARGVRLWAWCAWDTLFLPELLDATVQVTSVSPGVEAAIELQVAPGGVEAVTPAQVVVSFLKPEAPFDSDVITSFCHFVHFFPSREAGDRWVADHPRTFLLSLADAFELARISNRRFATVLAGLKTGG